MKLALIPQWNWSHFCQLSRAKPRIAPRRIQGGLANLPPKLRPKEPQSKQAPHNLQGALKNPSIGFDLAEVKSISRCWGFEKGQIKRQLLCCRLREIDEKSITKIPGKGSEIYTGSATTCVSRMGLGLLSVRPSSRSMWRIWYSARFLCLRYGVQLCFSALFAKTRFLFVPKNVMKISQPLEKIFVDVIT